MQPISVNLLGPQQFTCKIGKHLLVLHWDILAVIVRDYQSLRNSCFSRYQKEHYDNGHLMYFNFVKISSSSLSFPCVPWLLFLLLLETHSFSYLSSQNHFWHANLFPTFFSLRGSILASSVSPRKCSPVFGGNLVNLLHPLLRYDILHCYRFMQQGNRPIYHFSESTIFLIVSCWKWLKYLPQTQPQALCFAAQLTPEQRFINKLKISRLPLNLLVSWTSKNSPSHLLMGFGLDQVDHVQSENTTFC